MFQSPTNSLDYLNHLIGCSDGLIWLRKFGLFGIVALYDAPKDPSIASNIYETSDPKVFKHTLTQKFQFISFGQPKSLCDCPYSRIQDCLEPRHAKFRNNKREEEQIP
jgi:hypothetical protein